MEEEVPRELSKIKGLTTGAVTSLVDRFETKKLVKRQHDKSDRRKIIVVPGARRRDHIRIADCL